MLVSVTDVALLLGMTGEGEETVAEAFAVEKERRGCLSNACEAGKGRYNWRRAVSCSRSVADSHQPRTQGSDTRPRQEV